MPDKIKIRKPLERVERVRLASSLPSRAKQDFRDECNINNIMDSVQRTGITAHVNQYEGVYTDMPASNDYQENLNLILAAQQMFDDLPSSIRNRFSNDPAEFLAFAENPENDEEMYAIGLKKRPPPAGY